MDKKEIIEKVKAVVAAPSCCAELKAAGTKFLAVVGQKEEKEAARQLIAELEADVMSIDAVLGFFTSKAGQDFFGKEQAAALAAHAREVKANGGKFCDCAACAPGKVILDHKDVLL